MNVRAFGVAWWIAVLGCSADGAGAGHDAGAAPADGAAALLECIWRGAPINTVTPELQICEPDESVGTTPKPCPNDPRCPATFSALEDDTGVPLPCEYDGVICVYPTGEGQCSLDGSELKWFATGGGDPCPEYPPAPCSACSVEGITCGYYASPRSLSQPVTTNYCCDGNMKRWELTTTGLCPNGKVCGPIAASDYDRSCTKDGDCAAVWAGDLCDTDVCHCPNAAVNGAALTQYESDFDRMDPGGGQCPCPPGPPASCGDAGLCQYGP
jgi:hypothetical protein